MLAGLVLAAVVVGLTIGSGSGSGDANSHAAARRATPPSTSPAPGTLELRANGTTLARIGLRAYVRPGSKSLDRAALTSAVAAALPTTGWSRSGGSRILYRTDRSGALRAVAALGVTGGVVEVSRRARASRIATPVIAQALHNDCEAAALQGLLTTRGVRVDQLRLQAELPRNGPLDPTGSDGERVWGDPELGFVGRADGGGAAGGFGVYQGPIRTVAARHGQRLVDLSGRGPEALYQHLLAGHAVMAWIGLSDGPYGQWQSPAGRLVRVDYGEHAVVLNGIDEDGAVRIMNPLQGTQETWTRSRFESAWRLLGQRALGA